MATLRSDEPITGNEEKTDARAVRTRKEQQRWENADGNELQAEEVEDYMFQESGFRCVNLAV